MALRENWRQLEIVRNRTKIYELCIRNKNNGRADDISTYVIYFTVKKKMEDSDENALIKQKIGAESGSDYDHSDATSGKTLITLTPDDTNIPTGNYYYEMVIKRDEDDIIPALTGKIRVTEPVTKNID